MKTNKLTYMAFGIVLNVVIGSAVSILKVPFLYLDSLGTILIAAIFGPIAAALVGFLSNILLAIVVADVVTIFFGIVNAIVGIIAGIIFKKYGVNYVSAIVIGFINAFLAPAIGTPIALFFYAGLDFNASDIVKVYFNTLLDNFALSVYIEKVLNNLIDKLAGTLLIVFIIDRLQLTTKLKK